MASPLTATVTLSSTGTGTFQVSHQKAGIVQTIHQMSIRSSPSSNFKVTTTLNGFPLLSDVVVIGQLTAQGVPSIDIGDHDALEFTITAGISNTNIVLAYYITESGA